MRATIWLAGKHVYVGHADGHGVVWRQVSFRTGTTAGPHRVRVSGYMQSHPDGGYFERDYTVVTMVRYLTWWPVGSWWAS